MAADAKSDVQDDSGNTQASAGQCHWADALDPNFDKHKGRAPQCSEEQEQSVIF